MNVKQIILEVNETKEKGTKNHKMPHIIFLLEMDLELLVKFLQVNLFLLVVD
jgi:hypothetical protein